LRPPRSARRLLPAALVVLLPGFAAAQAALPPGEGRTPSNGADGRKYKARVYETRRLVGEPPTIDGRLDDAAWQQGEWAGDYTQQLPVEGAAPSQRTELKVLYDAKHVYFAIRAWDDPARVHRYPGRRDAFVGDIVGVCFDSYNDKRTGFEFDLTAGGSKIDLILGNGETEWDTTWDAVWDGKVAHDEHGWTAEFRVPLNQLRFGTGDELVWGMHSWRWIERNQEEDQWQLIPRQNSGRMHQLGELHGIRGVERPRHLELLPHVVGQSSSGPSIPDSPDRSGSLGLDAKLGLTSNFTLDATINPDFGQVEADPSVVNLTAYETFYEEKRPFFLEGRKILSFGLEDQDQLFYSRRIGQAPTLAPTLAEGETAQVPQSTTILGALKVTGKTTGGLSVGVMQSFTQRETAAVSSPLGPREPAVEPAASYTVARLHKDWGKGETSLGGMLTWTARLSDDPQLAALPTRAVAGGVDFTRYFADRSLVLEASSVLSRVSGSSEAISALQTDAVHYYQRPDADHLGLDPRATALSGSGGSLAFGTSGKGRLKLLDRFHWYSPGLELNDVGYLRQADVLANQAVVGWAEPAPRGLFRTYSLQLTRQDQWDFGGLAVDAATQANASATFRNKWGSDLKLLYRDVVDTRMLRGGPALRWHDYWEASLAGHTDPSRRLSAKLTGSLARALDDDTRAATLQGTLALRPSNRLGLEAGVLYDHLLENLQYAATAAAGDAPRYVLGRIDQGTWSFTLRANLAITPELTVQYYGSPFIGTGRYTSFKQATDTLAQANADRFHLYGPGEIAYREADNAYVVTEAGGAPAYTFANPDFSFRQFRSNLVARWEWKPGSSLYLVWSQGRTASASNWVPSFATNWDQLWSTPPDNVFLVKVSYWFSP
jgi:uncharacterized protein DUF5916